MDVLIGLLIIIIIMGLIFWSIAWFTHVSMVKGERVTYRWGTFKQFKRNLEIRKWRRSPMWRNSFFSLNGEDYCVNKIHADIIVFDSIGMILYPISYLRYCYYLYKHKYRAMGEYYDYIIVRFNHFTNKFENDK